MQAHTHIMRINNKQFHPVLPDLSNQGTLPKMHTAGGTVSL